MPVHAIADGNGALCGKHNDGIGGSVQRHPGTSVDANPAIRAGLALTVKVWAKVCLTAGQRVVVVG